MSDIKDLKFDDKNFNKHTEFGMGLLEKSLNKFGAGRSILVDKDNNIIAGNGIVEAAANAGLTKTKVVETTGDELVVVKRTDVALNSAQGREMALADNATAQADLEWDEENLKSEFDDEEIEGWGVDLPVMYDESEIVEDEVTEEDVPDEKDVISKTGEIYQLGEHRVACGDSLDEELIDRLFEKKTAKVIFSSPPYNMGKGIMYDKYEDNRSAEEYIEFNLDILKLWGKHHDGFLFWNVNNNANNNGYYLDLLCDIKNKTKYKMLEMIHWVKTHSIPVGVNSKNLKRIAENILLLEDSNTEIDTIFYGDDGNGKVYDKKLKNCIPNYWAIAHENEGSVAKKLNEATFPVKLPARGMSFTTKKGDIVADPFLGTGTTLIACEQLGRICYGCEMDERQVDVIRKRYWKFKTGSEEGWQDGTKAI